MNLGDLDVQRVQHNRPSLQRIHTNELPITPINVRLERDRSPSVSSTDSSDATTVIRWETPPSRIHTPPPVEPTKPEKQRRPIVAKESHASNTPLVVRFDEEQIRSDAVEASKRERMDILDLDSGPPTPNADDTEYIRFAINQLTRDQEVQGLERESTPAGSDFYPVDRIVDNTGLASLSSPRALHTREELALARKHRSSPDPEGLFRFNPTRPLSQPSDADLPNQPHQLGEIFIPVPPPKHTPRYPSLTFKPMILRPFSMIMLSILCLLMIAGIMFSAIYSTYHGGLVAWAAGIHGGRYFIFGFLPQILAACIFVYVQCVMAAVTRIMPFTIMAMDNAESRSNALFMGLYPRSLFFPRWEGPISLDFSMSLFWLIIFTIPLQSCLFAVIPVDNVWRWAPVQGVAWTLVAIYFLILIATVVTGVFFFDRTTGLIWDPRSLADLITLLPRSNSLKDYPGTDIMVTKNEIRDRLVVRSDRLGYWRTHNRNQGMFYCLGEEGSSTRRYTLEAGKLSKLQEKAFDADQTPDVEKAADVYSRRTRFRHVPWYLRDTFVIFWCVAAFILLLALIIVSFLPSTAIRRGFPPLVRVMPDSQGYSPANFLYSFIPSVLGMLLYLLFQPLDIALRRLQPWNELASSDGATAENSILIDYAANLPLVCTVNAFAAGHFRVGIMSLLSTLFILLPVLAGGLFFPLTKQTTYEVRMLPNLPSFYIILTLLILYLLALLLLLPNRTQLHLPHSVSCLAEIISFVHNSPILDDAAFRAPRSKADLVTRLTARSVKGEDRRYAFGIHRGRNGKECLGIERLARRGTPRVIVLSAN